MEENLPEKNRGESPSRLAKNIAIIGLMGAGIYILYILFGIEQFSTRVKTIGWLALFGLIVFFVQLLRTSGSTREAFWKDFFHGKGFNSNKERLEASRNILILFALVVLGILAVFFLQK